MIISETVKRTERPQAGAREAKEIDVEVHTGAIAVAGARDIATDAGGVAVGKGGGVGHTNGVILDDGSVAELASCAWDWVAIERAGSGGDRQARGQGEEG